MDSAPTHLLVIVDKGDGHVLTTVQQCYCELCPGISCAIDSDIFPNQVIVKQPVEVSTNNDTAPAHH